MAETQKRRGRPPKVENNYEFNSYHDIVSATMDSILNCSLTGFFGKETIESVIKNPIANHEEAIRLSNHVYSSNGIVSNAIDYCTALMCLDRVVTSPNSKGSKTKIETNKALMKQTLEIIKDKEFIRNALFTTMLDGIAFFYFETTKKKLNNSKYMTDYDVENITEINDSDFNASIISLPWQYTKIVGKVNGRYKLAFNLRYFDDFTGDTLENKLRKYPVEIANAYRNKANNNGDWYVLDHNRTMCRKIKCKDSEPWGRSLIIAALSDVLYKDYFVDTKRSVLDDMNSQVVYETFPENKQGTGSTLTAKQQQAQHDTVKGAIINKNGRKGINFISLAAGTKMDSIKIDTSIFDDKNESNLNNNIALDMGVAASLLGAMETGSFAASTSNLEMITSQLYSWVCEWANELNHVINASIIKDTKNKVKVYYFPTSFVNRKQFFDMMSSLYTTAGGSLTFLIASTGIDPDIYMSVLDTEIENKYFEKYLPHQTSFTISSKDDVGGRPTTDNPTENTVKSQSNNGNAMPSPSDNK